MTRLGGTYDRARESNMPTGKRSSDTVGRKRSHGNHPTRGRISERTDDRNYKTIRVDEGEPLPARESICFGDVVAVLFGGVVFCCGVIIWVSPTIGLFDGGIGTQRLAELTTSLGINTMVIWGLLLYSFGRETRSRGKPPLARLSNRHLELDKLLALITLHVSESERSRL